MTNDELWTWWCELDTQWKWLFLAQGLELNLWKSRTLSFSKRQNYQKKFDWLNRDLTLDYVRQIYQLQELCLINIDMPNLQPLTALKNLIAFTCNHGKIKDITDLTHLTQLVSLNLEHM